MVVIEVSPLTFLRLVLDIEGLTVCLLLKVFTRQIPFSELTDEDARKQILTGRRPGRPQKQDLTDQIWNMTTRCWQQDPLLRPKMMEVVQTLREWQVLLPLQHEHLDMLPSIVAMPGCASLLHNDSAL